MSGGAALARAMPAAVTELRFAKPQPGQEPLGRPAPPGGRSVGCGRSREASPALAGSGKRERHPEVDVGRFRPGGLLVLGLAAGTARVARPAVELAFRPAGLPPGSLASGAPLARLPAVPLAGFSLDPPFAVSVAAIPRSIA